MAKIKNIDIELYKRNVLVFIGSHDELLEYTNCLKNDKLYEHIAYNIINDMCCAESAYYYDSENGCGLIELHYHPNSPREIAIAAHECLHATMRIMSYVNVPCFQDESNEAYTYLHEYLVEQVLDYNNYKIVNTKEYDA